MSETVAPRYMIAANLRWFAVVYFLVTLAVIVGSAVAERYGLTVPSTGVSIGVLVGTTWVAGDRLAKSLAAWSSAQRHQLALGYTLVSTLLTIPLAVIAATVAVIFAGVPVAAFQALFAQYGLVYAIAIPIGILLSYAVARFALSQVAKARGLK